LAGYVNKLLADHSEPDVERYNPLLPQFTAAWFKVYLERRPVQYGIDFHDMLFGTGTTSLCTGGDGDMARCEVHA